jgi:hypothetical protein
MENIVYQGVRGKHGEQVLGHGETDMYLIKSNIEKKSERSGHVLVMSVKHTRK